MWWLIQFVPKFLSVGGHGHSGQKDRGKEGQGSSEQNMAITCGIICLLNSILHVENSSLVMPSYAHVGGQEDSVGWRWGTPTPDCYPPLCLRDFKRHPCVKKSRCTRCPECRRKHNPQWLVIAWIGLALSWAHVSGTSGAMGAMAYCSNRYAVGSGHGD